MKSVASLTAHSRSRLPIDEPVNDPDLSFGKKYPTGYKVKHDNGSDDGCDNYILRHQ
jgi:hypothetical protein